MWWIIGIIAALIIGGILQNKESKKNRQKDEDRLASIGVDLSQFITLGDYLLGHPDIDKSNLVMFGYLNKGSLELFHKSMDNSKGSIAYDTKKIAVINIDAISDVTIEDATTVEKRYSVGNIALFGAAGLAMRKTKTTTSAFLTIQWSDSKFSHDTLFRFGNVADANKSRNEIIRACKTSAT